MDDLKILFPRLGDLSANKDHISTNEFAEVINKAPQTIRKNYCLTGEAYGLKPTKVGNRLLWSVKGTYNILKGVKK
jgi:hypothetical protein